MSFSGLFVVGFKPLITETQLNKIKLFINIYYASIKQQATGKEENELFETGLPHFGGGCGVVSFGIDDPER